jgi:hypothetical protein
MRHVINLGAGVQSSTMALMATEGILTPMPEVAVFADTKAEPDSVYKWLEWLTARLAFPVQIVSAGNLAEKELGYNIRKRDGVRYRTGRIPAYIEGAGLIMRKCTRDFKIRPIEKFVRKFCQVKRGTKTPVVTQWIGISTDEIARMKPSRESWSKHRWPLIEAGISRADCLAWWKQKGLPTPPRSACVFCPYHNDAEWRRLRAEEPKEFFKAIAFEVAMQAAALEDKTRSHGLPFLHPQRVTLDKVTFKEDGNQKLFTNECEGMCGV